MRKWLSILVCAGIFCAGQASYAQNLLNNPESIFYDSLLNRYLVTNAGNGMVIQIDSTGAQSIFASGMVHSLSICLTDSALYVSTIDDLWAFNPVTGQRLPFYPIDLPSPTGSNFDGLAADTSGNLYMVDTGGRIIKIRLSDAMCSVFVTSGLTPYAQDIVFDREFNRLLVGSYYGGAPIQAVSLPDGTVSNVYVNTVGYIDGITMDKRGNVYVSHSVAGQIRRYPKGFTKPPDIISSGHEEPAGLEFNNVDNILVVPNYGANSVDFIPVDFAPLLDQWDSRDTAFGDGDGFFEPGETIEGRVTVVNEGFNAARGVSVRLTADDPSLFISQSEVSFGDVASGSSIRNDLTPFLIDIPDDYTARIDSMFLVMTWNEGAGVDTVAFTMAIGQISILLVDDDAGGNRERFYTEYLNKQRIPYRHWICPPSPTASDMAPYEIVIWYTGDYRPEPLNPDKIAAMKGYMDDGGKLFFTGQGTAAQLSVLDPAFLSDYLKAQYLSTKNIPLLPAAPGAYLLMPEDTAVIVGFGGAGNQNKEDQIVAVNGGIPELQYYGDPGLGGVSWWGSYKLVYMSFGFEGMINGDSRWIYRDTVYERILDQFQCPRPTNPMIISVTPGEIMRLVDHAPSISWSYHLSGFTQQIFHVQVGSDNDWEAAEMWDYGPMAGADTAVIYGGNPLEDGVTYYFRVQVGDGAEWSSWYYGKMRMNTAPTVPIDLAPDNDQVLTESPTALSHNNAVDGDGDALSYSYAVYDDSLMTALVTEAFDVPETPGGTTAWQLPAPLPPGTDYYWRVRAGDGYEEGTWSHLASFIIESEYMCGDANGDGNINVGDAVYVVTYIFRGGPAPNPIAAGDANCDGQINVGDAVYLVTYIFRGGPAPCCP